MVKEAEMAGCAIPKSWSHRPSFYFGSANTPDRQQSCVSVKQWRTDRAPQVLSTPHRLWECETDNDNNRESALTYCNVTVTSRHMFLTQVSYSDTIKKNMLIYKSNAYRCRSACCVLPSSVKWPVSWMRPLCFVVVTKNLSCCLSEWSAAHQLTWDDC